MHRDIIVRGYTPAGISSCAIQAVIIHIFTGPLYEQDRKTPNLKRKEALICAVISHVPYVGRSLAISAPTQSIAAPNVRQKARSRPGKTGNPITQDMTQSG